MQRDLVKETSEVAFETEQRLMKDAPGVAHNGAVVHDVANPGLDLLRPPLESALCRLGLVVTVRLHWVAVVLRLEADAFVDGDCPDPFAGE